MMISLVCGTQAINYLHSRTRFLPLSEEGEGGERRGTQRQQLARGPLKSRLFVFSREKRTKTSGEKRSSSSSSCSPVPLCFGTMPCLQLLLMRCRIVHNMTPRRGRQGSRESGSGSQEVRQAIYMSIVRSFVVGIIEKPLLPPLPPSIAAFFFSLGIGLSIVTFLTASLMDGICLCLPLLFLSAMPDSRYTVRRRRRHS